MVRVDLRDITAKKWKQKFALEAVIEIAESLSYRNWKRTLILSANSLKYNQDGTWSAEWDRKLKRNDLCFTKVKPDSV